MSKKQFLLIVFTGLIGVLGIVADAGALDTDNAGVLPGPAARRCGPGDVILGVEPAIRLFPVDTGPCYLGDATAHFLEWTGPAGEAVRVFTDGIMAFVWVDDLGVGVIPLAGLADPMIPQPEDSTAGALITTHNPIGFGDGDGYDTVPYIVVRQWVNGHGDTLPEAIWNFHIKLEPFLPFIPT
jgi:hypothetical protein